MSSNKYLRVGPRNGSLLFLTNRKQRVVVNESYSCWPDLTSGI